MGKLGHRSTFFIDRLSRFRFHLGPKLLHLRTIFGPHQRATAPALGTTLLAVHTALTILLGRLIGVFGLSWQNVLPFVRQGLARRTDVAVFHGVKGEGFGTKFLRHTWI